MNVCLAEDQFPHNAVPVEVQFLEEPNALSTANLGGSSARRGGRGTATISGTAFPRKSQLPEGTTFTPRPEYCPDAIENGNLETCQYLASLTSASHGCWSSTECQQVSSLRGGRKEIELVCCSVWREFILQACAVNPPLDEDGDPMSQRDFLPFMSIVESEAL
eukprot:CAMPEP_0172016596 /NCGR_PEP_ID=MMETSP1041-20130122/11108_1 /TAXON_ID=464988 /ORGANISM="Hemiselmis andersenii, Strain CCMP439" /LENGTH=162 /DNA_ID=CAMNT_0012671555 /DNA_START=81 /DNA_END=567 /DNA_ORIENTATION=+